jgi:hypothetical protein
MEKEVEEYYGKGSWSNIVIDKTKLISLTQPL